MKPDGVITVLLNKVPVCEKSHYVPLFQVTVFQVVQDPGRAGEFAFTVDASLVNVTVYITGFSPLAFNLTSPSGDVSGRCVHNISPLLTRSRLTRRSFSELRPGQRAAGFLQHGWKSASVEDPRRQPDGIVDDPGGFSQQLLSQGQRSVRACIRSSTPFPGGGVALAVVSPLVPSYCYDGVCLTYWTGWTSATINAAVSNEANFLRCLTLSKNRAVRSQNNLHATL